MLTKILSKEDISTIIEGMAMYNNAMRSYRDALNTIIESFEDEDIVQSFFFSGNFGQQQMERLKKLKVELENFCNLITKEKGLLSKTKEYVDKAIALNNTGKI